MCVTNGRAAAPPCCVCSIGVSTSMKPRACEASRAATATTVGARRDVSRAAGAHDEVDVALPDAGLLGQLGCTGSGSGRSALAAIAHVVGHAPTARRGGDEMTSPVTKTWSPRSTSAFHAASELLADAGRGRASPAARCRRRPAAWRSRACRCCGRRPRGRRRRPVAGRLVPASRSGYAARTSASVWVRGTADRVGLDAGGEQPLPLLPADPHLLGQVGVRIGSETASSSVPAASSELGSGPVPWSASEGCSSMAAQANGAPGTAQPPVAARSGPTVPE